MSAKPPDADPPDAKPPDADPPDADPPCARPLQAKPRRTEPRHHGLSRRFLRFSSADDCLAEVQSLHAGGYDQTGDWNLSQICEHMTAVYDRSIDGYSVKRPWIFRATIGRVARALVLRSGRIPSGVKAPAPALPTKMLPEPESIARFQAALRRVTDHAGDFDSHPIFGRMSASDNKRLHLIHAAHHLGHLVPKQNS